MTAVGAYVPSSAVTLVDVLAARAAAQPHGLAYTFVADGEPDVTLTWAELEREVRAVADRLAGSMRSGDRALLLYPPGLAFVAALFGCMAAGVVPVPLLPPDPTRLARTAPRVHAIAKDADADVALTTTALAAMRDVLVPHGDRFTALDWIATDELPLASTDRHLPAVAPDTLALLQYTSGSTGDPRGVCVTHRHLLGNVALLARANGHGRHTRIVSWLPQYHDMGLMGAILSTLLVGCSAWILSPLEFMRDPLGWWRTVSRVRGTYTGGPNFAFDYCVRKATPTDLSGLDLGCVEAIVTASEPVRAATVERFLSTFAACGLRPQTIAPYYGLAEATVYAAGAHTGAPATFRRFDAGELAAGRVVAVAAGDDAGVALLPSYAVPPEHRFVIVDPDTRRRRPPDRVGEIWLAGESVAAGYWNRPGTTAERFAARIADDFDGPFLRTGDLGFVHDGALFVTGRHKDVIVVRGRNVYPQDVEHTAERAHPDVRPGGVAAFGIDGDGDERIVVAAEVAAPATATAAVAAIRTAVATAHQIALHTVVPIARGTLPKTSSGKVQRHATRRAFLGGTLAAESPRPAETTPAAAAPSAPVPDGGARAESDLEPTERWLAAAVADELQLPAEALDADTPLVALGLDSLSAVALQHRIERRLRWAPDVDVLFGTSLGRLAAILAGPAPVPGSALVPSGPPGGGDAPPSQGQLALWVLHQLAPQSTAYHIARAVRVIGPLDTGALQRALQALVDRHAALRTTFPTVDGRPVQRIQPRAGVAFREEDAAGWATARLDAHLEAEATRPFDLANGPLLRVAVLTLGPNERIIALACHHIVVDHASFVVLARELAALYRAAQTGRIADLPPVIHDPGDFARWQAALLDGPRGDALRSYWRGRLAGPLPVLDLPTDRPRPVVQSYSGARVPIHLAAPLAARLQELARDAGATPFMVVVAAFQALLHRHSGQTDVVVGSPAGGRTRPEWQDVVGYFVNSLALRTTVEPELSFAALLAAVRGTVLGALAHQDLPFPLAVRETRAARDPGRTPIFQAMCTFLAAPPGPLRTIAPILVGDPTASVALDELRVEPMPLETRGAQLDLSLTMADSDAGLVGTLEYDTALFDADTAAQLAHQLECLLEAAVTDPERSVASLPLATPFEHARLVEAALSAHGPPPPATAAHQLVVAQAARVPTRVAVRADDGVLRYAELDARANRIAQRLRALGVGRDVPVGIHLDRSTDLVAAALAVWKAGGAYVPLDPRHPPSRLAFICADVRCPVVVTTAALLGRLDLPSTHALCLDRDADVIAAAPPEPPAIEVSADDLAYVIFTSGSTGRPKGVAVPHGAVVNFLAAMARRPGLAAADVLLAVTTLGFDIAVLELFLPLTVGAQVVVASHETASDGRGLARVLGTSGATVMQATPATWRMLLDAGWRSTPGFTMLCGGETLPRDLARRLVAGGGTLWNLYGPTEATVWCAVERVAAIGDAPIPLGTPVDHTELWVLDAALQPVPAGVRGELFVGGRCLARGYVNRPEQTAERFVPHPFSREPGARLYRTGDCVRRRADGRLEFLGRLDHQLKLRGFRIEPGEIEAAIRRQPGIRDAVVMARPTPAAEPQLVAYVVSDAPAANGAFTERVRAGLGADLPPYMLPAVVVPLSSVPLTPSGKIDRAALPEPAWRPAAMVAPRTPLEEAIAELWADVLAVERVGVEDDFFALGGDSLRAVQLCTKLGARIGRDVPVDFVLHHPTVARAATALGPDAPIPRPATGAVEAEPASPFITHEPRSLLALLAAGRLAPVDAVAFAALPGALVGEDGAAARDVVTRWCGDMPLWAATFDTAMGRIGLVMLPRFDAQLYEDRAALLADLGEACDLARHIGARTVSLTGLLASATDYGHALIDVLASREQITVTTGHATTVAAVAMTVRETVARLGRDLRREHVACLGLGSIGAATLRLLLDDASPAALTLCDVFAKQESLAALAFELKSTHDYGGPIRVLASRGDVPPEVYDATVVIGATNVPGILDIARLRPGTIVVDDSFPYSFAPAVARRRIATGRDVVCTAGGVLRAPYPITAICYRPHGFQATRYEQVMPWIDPREIGGCVLSGLLSQRHPEAVTTIGLPPIDACRAHLRVLQRLGFGAAHPHCDGTPIADEVLEGFRRRFGDGATTLHAPVGLTIVGD